MSDASWHEITLLGGSVASRRSRSSEEIAPHAVAWARSLWADSSDVPRTVPLPGPERLSLEMWRTPGGSAAVVTFSDPAGPLCAAIYLSGLVPEEDAMIARLAQDAFVVDVLRGTPMEPGFDLDAEEDRPLVAAIIFAHPAAEEEDGVDKFMMAGETESVLAAGFFRPQT